MSLLKEELDLYSECFFLRSPHSVYKACISFCKRGDLPIADFVFHLHEDEVKHLNTMQYEKRINSYLLGRYCIKTSISNITNQYDLNKIIIKNGVFNQPIVISDSIANIQISLAHSNDMATAVAFDEMVLLGVDIEKKNQATAEVIAGELTQHEWSFSKPLIDLDESFLLLLWTVKESLSKILKTGLTLPLSILEVQSVDFKDGYYISAFSHFFQYNAISWIDMDYVFSMTYPKNLEIDLNIDRFKKKIRKYLYQC